jgi:hypothetical protein
MKWTALVAASAIALVSLAARAAPREQFTVEKSPDLLRPQQLRKPAFRVAPVAIAGVSAAAMAAPAPEDVGDADSFGRNVTYLGLAQSLPILIVDDCTGSDPAAERCLVAQPAPLITNFDEADLATINLPAKATKSLMCFALTPLLNVSWTNFTSVQQTARFNAAAEIIIDDSVLDDPALIDPNSGLPFGGSLSVGLSTWSNSHSIGNGEFENERSQQSRSCIAGIISKRQLVETYGLSETLANQFFKKAMTLHFGAYGAVAMADFTSYFYGVRLYGD